MTEHPIADVVERWHRNLRGELPGGLDSLLADDVVFYSPVVYTPQHGREVTKVYLTAAFATLVPPTAVSAASEESPAVPKFGYTKQVLAGDTAVLEFETNVAGKYINGVDIIRCNADGQIVEFRVMIRPLQAINLIHDQMRALLEQFGPPKQAVGDSAAS